ncbi:hypothetical protein [Plantactinospora sp. KLBMP9567]|uniref:hypothetical protein n=1 Tax=Plantactinospora sp. KLBMP9567 TaxID=3085900 RepID=UPI002980D731|nr:hypothetical protein [Plantactinospora sp. KLBMP9567]MDW5328687.1 hypothetical protein [Plantactinospora sp. KLBMP9567]
MAELREASVAFWVVRDRVRLEAGHLLDRSSAPGTHTIEYCETARTATRPAHGKTEQVIHCGHCGHPVPFTVFSVALTRRRRLYAYGLGAILLVAAAMLYGVGIDVVVAADSALWPLLLAGAEIVLIALAVMILSCAAAFEHGVRSPALWRGGQVPYGGHLAMIDPHLGRKPLARNASRVISSVHHHPPDDNPSDGEPSGGEPTGSGPV